MRARFVFEKFTNDDSDPIKDMNIGIGRVVQLKSGFKEGKHNSHYTSLNKLVKKGGFIGVKITNETMMNMYEQLQDLIVPFFQNQMLYSIKDQYDNDAEDIKKLKGPRIITHQCTNGRYDVNYSVTWFLSPKQINLAKRIYKGKHNDEYPFFLLDTDYHLSFIISKSGKFVTLVFEGDCPPKAQKYFTKSPSGVYHLGEWKRPNEIVNLVKTIVSNL